MRERGGRGGGGWPVNKNGNEREYAMVKTMRNTNKNRDEILNISDNYTTHTR